ncbi:hypothetical protein G5I_02464 [Acromyrmex echinatior]|uniref:Uncharacterized protein n=1 Tax=Acromyrmex echinatior TaxID=103372 RepID=F4WAC8_ACREC|nr:hypothetical protein G5I_02464 [Acromyrmex echinatior]
MDNDGEKREGLYKGDQLAATLKLSTWVGDRGTPGTSAGPPTRCNALENAVTRARVVNCIATCRTRPPSSAVSLPLGFCREGRQTHTLTTVVNNVRTKMEVPKVVAAAAAVKESEREFPFAAYVAAGRTL